MPLYPNFDKEADIFINLAKRAGLGKNVKLSNIKTLMSAAFKQKARLKDLLGMGDDLRVRILVRDMEQLHQEGFFIALHQYMMVHHPEILEALPEDVELGDIILSNVIHIGKRGLRFSRYLSKIVNLDDFQRVAATIWKLDAKFHDWNKFVATLFDNAASMNRTVILSANPLDFLLASEQAGFTSCHDFDGQHCNGNLAYAMDQHTLVAFMIQDKPNEYPFYKIGRSWVYIPENNKQFILGRAYGQIFAPQVRMISQHISQSITDKLGEPYEWVAKSDFQFPKDKLKNIGHAHNEHNRFPGYFDLEVARYVYHKSLQVEKKPAAGGVPTLIEPPLPTLLFEDALCLLCGSRTKHSYRFTCGNCTGNVACHQCGDQYDRDTMLDHQGTLYCEECYNNEFTTCVDCDAPIRTVDAHNIGHNWDDRFVCNGCRNNYKECEDCGELYGKAQLEEKAGVKVCEGCAENYTDCTQCGKNFHDDDLISVKFAIGPRAELCAECANGYEECNECHQYFEPKLVQQRGRISVCSECDVFEL